MEKLGRLITAMITPFDDRGNVDYAQAKKLALALIASGSDGVVVSGTTGESPTLSKEEKLKLFAEIKSAVGSKGAVIAGTGSYNTAESVALTREAEATGVDAALLVVPYYNKPTQDGLYEHFKAIAGGTKLPCIVYNVPSRTITNLGVETAIKLSHIENIVGVKEASGNLEQIARIIEGTRDNFAVFSGNDADTLPIMALGGYGVISVVSHLVGLQIKDMIDRFVKADTEGAAAAHRRLLPLFNAMFIVSNPIPVKYAVNKVGFRAGKPRLPLLEPDAKTAAAIDAVLKGYKIDLPVGAQKGDLFQGEINDLSKQDATGWQRRDITFYKQEIRSLQTYAYPAAGDSIVLIDTSGASYTCKCSQPDKPESVCIGESQNLRPWYRQEGYSDDYVNQVGRDGGKDKVIFEYTGQHPRFYIYTEKQFKAKYPSVRLPPIR